MRNKSDLFLLICIPVLLFLAVPTGFFHFNNIWGAFGRSNGLMTKVPLLFLALILSLFSTNRSIVRFFWWCFALLVIEVSYGVIQLTGIDPFPWVNPYHNIFVTAGNPNFAAALFAILVVVVSRFVIVETKVPIKVSALVLVVAGIYMSYATASVQGILTIAAAIFLMMLIGLIRSDFPLRRKRILSSALVLGGLPIALGVFNIGPLKSFLYQETLSIRLHYWRVAIRIIRDHPWFGVGLDNYGDYYRLYREEWFVKKYTPGLISSNAHNVALQWGSDSGVIGFLMYLGIAVAALLVYIKSFRLTEDKKVCDLDLIFVSFFAFYLQSLISISQISVTVLGFALFGILLAKYRLLRIESDVEGGGKRSKKHIQRSEYVGFGTIWIIVFLALTPITSLQMRHDLALRKAMAMPGIAQKVPDLAPRSESIKSAIKPFLSDQDYVAMAIQNLYGQGNAQVGVEIAQRATEVNPRSWVGFQSQVLAFAQSNAPKEAVGAAKKVLELDPLNYNIQFNLSQQQLKIGDTASAEINARKVLAIAPVDSDAYKGSVELLKSMGKQ